MGNGRCRGTINVHEVQRNPDSQMTTFKFWCNRNMFFYLVLGYEFGHPTEEFPNLEIPTVEYRT